MPFIRNKKIKIETLSHSLRKAPQNTSGSLTVEAALVFPMVLFVLLFFLSFFRVLQVQEMTQEALALAGAKASLEAEGKEGNDGILYGKALAYFHGELLHQSFPQKYVQGGSLGFSYQGTKTDGESIDLNLEYRISLPMGILKQASLPVHQRVYLKKWTGFHGLGESENGDWVYVTETGTVYHASRECTHLKLSIQTVAAGQISSQYSPCHLCGEKEGLYRYYYITQEGTRYHRELNCSGLKRTVYMKKRSEVGGRPGCSRCGGTL